MRSVASIFSEKLRRIFRISRPVAASGSRAEQRPALALSDPSIVENGKHLPTTPADFGPDLFNDFVINFARRHREQPFFIYYTSVLTHGPRVETPDPTKPGARWLAGLKSNLEYLDHLMGKLLSALKADGLASNSYIFFIGDNGTAGDSKATPTELGARVPGIVWGADVKRGVVSHAVPDLTDILPTLADMSGATLPKDCVFDGKSFAPVLRGTQPRHRDWIYSHLDDTACSATSVGCWKFRSATRVASSSTAARAATAPATVT